MTIPVSVFFWDIFLWNEKDTNSLSPDKVSAINTDFMFSSDGQVSHGRYLVSKVRCWMDLRSYPHDIQTCELKFRSRVFAERAMKFTKPSVQMSEMALESSSLEIFSFHGHVIRTPSYGRNFSEAIIEIKLQRRLEYFLYQVCFLFTFASHKKSVCCLFAVSPVVGSPKRLNDFYQTFCRFISPQLLW